MEKVQIIVLSRNYAEFLPDTINSIINQTYKDWHCYITDGGSTDNSMQVANSFSDKRITTISTLPDTSICRTHPISRMSNSPYIMWIAADDKIEPTFLEENIKVLEENNVDLVYNSYVQHKFSETGKHLGQKECKLLTPEHDLMNGMYCGVFWLMKRKVWEDVGGFIVDGAMDYAFVLHAQYNKVKMMYLDKNLGWYRDHPKSDSSSYTPFKFWELGETTRNIEKDRRNKCK